MSYLDNDDDLFEYDPETDSPKFNLDDLSVDDTSSANPLRDFISKITMSDADELAVKSFLDPAKVKMAMSFQVATNRHFTKSDNPAYIKAINIMLDKITGGDFSLYHLLYRKQILIAERLVFLSMMDALIESSVAESHEDDSIFKFFSELGVDFSRQHIELFYGPSINVCRHALNLDRAIYSHLCDKLNIAIVPELLDPEYRYSSNPDPIDKVNTLDYLNQIFKSITSTLSHDGLLDKISQTFSTNVTLVDTKNNEENL